MKIKNFQVKKQKISKILIGSNNKGKIKEICDLLPKKIKVLGTKDYNLKSPKENGKTFEENSLIKAKYYFKKTKMIKSLGSRHLGDFSTRDAPFW